MTYIAEVLEDHKVWLLNENRRLVSIHSSITEAREACRKSYKSDPQIVDRRHKMASGKV